MCMWGVGVPRGLDRDATPERDDEANHYHLGSWPADSANAGDHSCVRVVWMWCVCLLCALVVACATVERPVLGGAVRGGPDRVAARPTREVCEPDRARMRRLRARD